VPKDKGADFIVAKDGTGHYSTVNQAVAAAPEGSVKRFTIYVKRGVYREVVRVGEKKSNITIIGDGKDLTILTGNLNHHDGTKTFDSATLAVEGVGFVAQDLCIQNTAGPQKGQAVALLINAKRAVVYRCRIEGFLDTLYAFSGDQFYRDCQITGTVDFIFGHATAVFQNCQIKARKPGEGQTNVLTAQSRDTKSDFSVFSFQQCNLTASSELRLTNGTVKTFLGRPWHAFSTVVFMECFIDGFVDSAGWLPWHLKDHATLSTLYYGEYKNSGPGADTTKRVSWKGYKIITDRIEAARFTVGKLFPEHLWIKSTGIPYQLGL
ncbi:hypothetical protein CARUB_v10009760mg, partial [Capsella rubella]